MGAVSEEKPCVICQRADESTYLVRKTEHWTIRHSDETVIVGYVVLEPRRHFLDMSHATDEEARSYGIELKNIIAAVRKATNCERVYTFSLGESCPHFHLHIIPRGENFPQEYFARGIMQYPLTPGCDAAVVAKMCNDLKVALGKTGVAASS